MWYQTPPKPIGLKCDCCVQYCTLFAAYFVCGLLIIAGSFCLLGIGSPLLCLEQGIMGGILLLFLGASLPCCYCGLFITLGEGGRRILHLKSLASIPSKN
eukprot:TRINITY_DN3544_c0_g1_i1.p1 TRINITY_DN3544_c0_g1~~TRINITY_DN3544_c0_g1_i1.p1  ORF type:complete len:100 (+),score=14.26 TRINITY_DN3544_c0_g1_i1:110-409(+)